VQGVGKYCLLVLTAIAVGMWRLFPKQRILIELQHCDTTIEVLFGDLFTEAPQIVIPVNDCFDSQLQTIVSANSLHGIFITRILAGVSKTFDELVASALRNDQPTTIPRPDGGRPLRYSIGTTVCVPFRGNEYYLVALAKTDPTTSVANATLAEFWLALEGLWKQVRIHANNEDVAVPLLGSGLARVGLPQSQLLYFLITSFVAETKRQKITGHIKIVLHESTYAQINLSEFERNWIK